MHCECCVEQLAESPHVCCSRGNILSDSVELRAGWERLYQFPAATLHRDGSTQLIPSYCRFKSGVAVVVAAAAAAAVTTVAATMAATETTTMAAMEAAAAVAAAAVAPVQLATVTRRHHQQQGGADDWLGTCLWTSVHGVGSRGSCFSCGCGQAYLLDGFELTCNLRLSDMHSSYL